MYEQKKVIREEIEPKVKKPAQKENTYYNLLLNKKKKFNKIIYKLS